MSGKVTDNSAWTMPAEVKAPTPTAVWACRSCFCFRRGPFWVRSERNAQIDAGLHRARRFLGLFAHDAVVRPSRGQSFLAFLHEMRLSGA
jgi:hypothetical protein